MVGGEYSSSADVLDAALLLMERKSIKITARSAWYSSEPVPISDQNWFVNGIVCVRCSYEPEELLSLLHDIEGEMGRVRKIHWGERLIDLDLISYGQNVLPSKKKWSPERQLTSLVLPHPLMHQRHFVLRPLKDIAPNWEHPILKKTVSEMLLRTPPDGKVHILD